MFRDRDYTSPNDEREKLPYEHKNIAGAVAAVTKDVTELFRQAKGIVEMMPRYTHMEGFTFRQVSKPSWADNVVWMNIYCGDEQVGNLALLSKRASMDCGIKNLSVMLFELDQELLKPLRSRTNTFTHMPEYPVADYDVSVLLDREVKWEAVREAILGKHTAGLLKDAPSSTSTAGKQGAGRQEVRHHPPDHRLAGEDTDLRGDRGVRVLRAAPSGQEARRGAALPLTGNFSSLHGRVYSVYWRYLLEGWCPHG